MSLPTHTKNTARIVILSRNKIGQNIRYFSFKDIEAYNNFMLSLEREDFDAFLRKQHIKRQMILKISIKKDIVIDAHPAYFEEVQEKLEDKTWRERLIFVEYGVPARTSGRK